MSLKYTIRNFVRNHIPESMVMKYKMAHSTKYPIVKNPLDYFQPVYHIKDDTWEPLHMPEIYQMSKPYDLEVFHGKQDILLIPNAQVSDNSDIVITEHGVVWDKYYNRVFSKVVPMDRGLLTFNQEYVCVRNANITEYYEGKCISMLGVFEGIWSHFLVQFLPKLYYAEEAGLLDENVTILLPSYKDKQISQLVNDILSRHPTVNVSEICEKEGRVSFRCDELYYIPTASCISNHLQAINFYDCVIPNRVQTILRERVVKSYVDTQNELPSEYEKLYLVRRGIRNATNVNEIENYFISKGFKLVDPGAMTLEEKICIFNYAKYIAGPASSAWSNVIFCNGCKALNLRNLNRVTDPFSCFLMPIGNVQTLILTGWDLERDIHSSYTISIEDLNEAYLNFFHKH